MNEKKYNRRHKKGKLKIKMKKRKKLKRNKNRRKIIVEKILKNSLRKMKKIFNEKLFCRRFR